MTNSIRASDLHLDHIMNSASAFFASSKLPLLESMTYRSSMSVASCINCPNVAENLPKRSISLTTPLVKSIESIWFASEMCRPSAVKRSKRKGSASSKRLENMSALSRSLSPSGDCQVVISDEHSAFFDSWWKSYGSTFL